MSVESLNVFRLGHELTLHLYHLTSQFPSGERFGLVSQIRRASSSICSNLMEGYHRNHQKEYRQFVGIARGSVGELKYHLLLAKDLGYLAPAEYDSAIDLTNEISKMLFGLIRTLTLK